MWCFIGRVRYFTNDFWQILKVLLKKNIDMWNILFFLNSAVYYLFFYFFYYFWHFIFNFFYLYLSKNSRKFDIFLFYGLEVLSKNFGNSWNVYQKNIDIWNPKFQQNSIVYYFFFIFLAFLALCLLFHVPKLVEKLWNFLWCFIGRVRYFSNDFWNILKVHLKKILICEIFCFF